MLRLALGTTCFAALLGGLTRPARAEASLHLVGSPVVAGEVAKLRLHLDAPPRAPLRGTAGLGAIGAFVKVAPLTYQADYAPPKNSGPALSAIVVYEDAPGGAVAYALANIVSMVNVRTTVRGHSPVFVRAGSGRYGPFIPGKRGKVTLRFPANGELTSASLESAMGNPRGTVKLTPALREVVVVARPSKLRPGDARPPELLLLTAYQRALRFDAPRATASAGKVAVDVSGSTNALVRYVLSPPTPVPAAIDVSFVDSLHQKVGTARFTAAGPAVAKIAVKIPAKALGPGQRTLLDVSLLDAQGRSADGDLSVEADCGKVSPPLQLAPGIYNVGFTAPAQVCAAGVVHLVARDLDGPAVTRVELPLHGGPPAQVIFDTPAKAARAGGKLEVALQVLDADGNPAEPRDLQIAVDHGTVGAVREQSTSRFVVDVTTDRDASALTLTARDGDTGLSGDRQLDLAPSGVLPRVVVGPEVGFNNNFGKLSSANVAVSAQLLVGPRGSAALSGSLGFLAGYLPASTRSLTSDRGTHAQLELSRVALMARAGGFGAVGRLGLFGGLGLGAMKLSGDLSNASLRIPLDTWRPAFGLYGGAGYKLGPGYLSVEVRATYAELSAKSDGAAGASAHVGGLVGGIDGSLGYLFTL